MHHYFFVLGTNHSLCKIDIVNQLIKQKLDFEIIEASEEMLLVSTPQELLINQLGSSAKIGEVFRIYEKNDFSANALKKEFGQGKLGVSIYNVGGKLQLLDKIFRQTRSLGSVREKGRILSTVTVDRNNLLQNGMELVIGVGSKAVYLAKTLAIQDYQSYSLRDYGRPDRDSHSGMIPPKLAKIMINLANKDQQNLIIDPFCGSGTILQELVLLGYKNILGSDLSQKAITDSQKNLTWLFEEYKLKKDVFNIELLVADVKNLSLKLKQKPGAIITEPYLGTSGARHLFPEQIKKEIKTLSDLYLAAFLEFKKICAKNCPLVIIFPIFRFKSLFFKLEILDQLKQMGFETKDFLISKPKGEGLLKLQITPRNSIVYFRPGQNVSREIFIFQKTS